MNKKQYKGHGEVIFLEVDELPAGVEKMIPNSSMLAKGGLIVGKSETSGNHHCVELVEGIEFFEKNGTLYMRNNNPTKAYCSLDSLRHPDVDIQPGVWKIKIQKEFDLLERLRRNVAD